MLNRSFLDFTDGHVPGVYKEMALDIIKHRDRLVSRSYLHDKLILPVGINHQGGLTLSVFNNLNLVNLLKDFDERKCHAQGS